MVNCDNLLNHLKLHLVRYAKRKAYFFQAEDGIRGGTVTGVQTCALPIFCGSLVPFATAVCDIHCALVIAHSARPSSASCEFSLTESARAVALGRTSLTDRKSVV